MQKDALYKQKGATPHKHWSIPTKDNLFGRTNLNLSQLSPFDYIHCLVESCLNFIFLIQDTFFYKKMYIWNFYQKCTRDYTAVYTKTPIICYLW